ncbi:hypothetical protein KHQ89_07205 [Mycoplasmatota bacterium]|nr:hypothetical protein KHQ89_07205 [Mycoplasmatota bacterium]
MHYIWGIITLFIGLFLLLSALRKSDFIVYKMFVARAKLLWKDKVHSFFAVVGVILMLLSLLFFFGIWG